MAGYKTTSARPRLIILASSDGRRIADGIQLDLDDEVESVVFAQGVFEPGEATVAALDRMSKDFDFAALVVTPGDLVETGDVRRTAVRDTVVFEAGLFVGRLGLERTFLVCPEGGEASLPSELAGLAVAHYPVHGSENLRAALGPTSFRIREGIDRALGRAWTRQPEAAQGSAQPTGVVPRPRRCNTLGIAVTRVRNEEFRIVNISVSGAFLETGGELPVGRILGLDLRLDDDSIVSLTARVVRVQRPDWRRIGGVGVAFTSVPEEAARALEAFVASGSCAA